MRRGDGRALTAAASALWALAAAQKESLEYKGAERALNRFSLYCVPLEHE